MVCTLKKRYNIIISLSDISDELFQCELGFMDYFKVLQIPFSRSLLDNISELCEGKKPLFSITNCLDPNDVMFFKLDR